MRTFNSIMRCAAIAVTVCFASINASAMTEVTSANFDKAKVYYIQNADTLLAFGDNKPYLALQSDYAESNEINATPLVSSSDDAALFTITGTEGSYKLHDGLFYMSVSTSTTAQYANYNTGYSGDPYYWDIQYVEGKGFTIKSSKGYLMYDGKGNQYAYTDGTESSAHIYWNIYSDDDIVLPTTVALSESGDFSLSGLSESFDVELQKVYVTTGKNPICLPFSMTAAQVAETFGAGTNVYEMNRIVNGYVYYQVKKNIKAGVPYMVMPTVAADDNKYEVKDVTAADFDSDVTKIDLGDYILYGLYKPATVYDFYTYNNGTFTHYSTSQELKAFSSYLQPVDPVESSPSKLAEATEWTEDEVDGISTVSFQYSDKTPIYNTNGQIVRRSSETTNGLNPGVYVINGKKVLVK